MSDKDDRDAKRDDERRIIQAWLNGPGAYFWAVVALLVIGFLAFNIVRGFLG